MKKSLILFSCLIFVNGQEDCQTNQEGEQKGVPCIFPFIFNDISRNGCIRDDDPDDKLWCSTKVDENGKHVGGQGQWGYCPRNCPEHGQIIFDDNDEEESVPIEIRSGSRNTKCKTTRDSEPGQRNKLCSLPFILKGKLRNSCIKDFDPDGRWWCSTKTDENSNHVAGNWGYCDSSCFTNTRRTKRPFNRRTTTTTRRPTTTRRTTPATRQVASVISDTANGLYQPREDKNTCGLYLGQGFILGGEATKEGEIPFAVALGYRNGRGGFKYSCGGTLINRRYVLTAAHCHDLSNPKNQIAEVVLGDHNLSKDPDCDFSSCKKAQRFSIRPQDVTLHKDWDIKNVVKNANDIALVRLPRPAITTNEDSNELVLPACMGWTSDIQVPTDTYIVAGWGRTNNNFFDRGDFGTAGAHSEILKKLKVSFIEADVCKREYDLFKDITSNKQICAGGVRGEDSCSGDSGGPLISQRSVDFKETKYLVGIVSFGTKRCGLGLPGVYTDLRYYMPWIIQNMKP